MAAAVRFRDSPGSLAIGEPVHIWSRASGCWKQGEVTGPNARGLVTVEYEDKHAGGRCRKHLVPDSRLLSVGPERPRFGPAPPAPIGERCSARDSTTAASSAEGEEEEEEVAPRSPSTNAWDKERWLAEQEAVAEWEDKELAHFLVSAAEHGFIAKPEGCSWHKKANHTKVVSAWGDRRQIIETVRADRARVLGELLNLAVEGSWEEVIRFLTMCPESINCRPLSHSRSFIHLAADQDDISVVKQLLQIGADMLLETASGLKPSQVASQAGRSEMASFLKGVEQKHLGPRLRTLPAQTLRGVETLCAPVMERTSSTLYESQRDVSFSTFSKFSAEAAWDASATSCTGGITQLTVHAIRHEGPVLIGLTTDRSDDHLFCSGFAVGYGSLEGRRFRHQHLGLDKSASNFVFLEGVGANDVLRLTLDGEEIRVYANNKLMHTFRADLSPMYAKLFLHKSNDAMSLAVEPQQSIPGELQHSMNLRSQDFKAMLKGVLHHLLPPWLRKEVEDGTDPEDRSGHVMYFCSLITTLTTRSWTAQELQDMDDVERKDHVIAFNYEWTTDLWKVIKKVWNDGGVPNLGNLRARFHTKIPGSCKNKAVLAIAYANLLKPGHRWAPWSVWRVRTDEEVRDRFPNKDPSKCCFTQLHCLCCHLGTSLWFDVIRFWDRDPFHRRSMDLPEPDLIRVPCQGTFDLRRHTTWLQNEAGPGGKFGYDCAMWVQGVAPKKLRAYGVRGDKQTRAVGEEEEEEEDEEFEVDEDCSGGRRVWY